MTPIVWGVLGTARIGLERVIPAMQQSDLCDVRAIASRDARRAAEAARAMRVPVVRESYEALLADPGIEAIYNPLPNHLHVEWSIRALEAGKHVLCEKPLACSAAEVQPLIEARDRTGLLVEEAVMVRDHPQWSCVRDLIDGGRIGAVRNVQLGYSHFTEDPEDIRNREDMGGGSLLDVGSYCCAIVRLIFGTEPLRAMALLDRDPRFGDRPLHDRGARIFRWACELLLLVAELPVSGGADRRNDGLDTGGSAVRASARSLRAPPDRRQHRTRNGAGGDHPLRAGQSVPASGGALRPADTGRHPFTVADRDRTREPAGPGCNPPGPVIPAAGSRVSGRRCSLTAAVDSPSDRRRSAVIKLDEWAGPALANRAIVRKSFGAGLPAAQSKAIWVFIDRLRSLAIRNASSASSRGMVWVITGLTSTSPDCISFTAVANSSWKRNEPRRSSSFTVICIMGTVMSPPSPSCMTTPARTHRRDSTRQGPGRARALVEHVEPALVGGVRIQCVRSLGHVDGPIGTGRRSVLQGVRHQVGGDDLRRSRASRGHDREHPDRPAPGHQHALAQQLAGPARGVKTHRQGLRHRRLGRGQPVGPHALGGVGHQLFAERALDVRKRHGRSVEAHVQALVVQSLAAEPAGPAGTRRRHRDEIARREAVDPLPHFGDVSGDFVTEDHRLLQANRSEAAVVVVVQVRTADAAGGQADPDLSGSGRPRFALLDAQIPCLMDDDGSHADLA